MDNMIKKIIFYDFYLYLGSRRSFNFFNKREILLTKLFKLKFNRECNLDGLSVHNKLCCCSKNFKCKCIFLFTEIGAVLFSIKPTIPAKLTYLIQNL